MSDVKERAEEMRSEVSVDLESAGQLVGTIPVEFRYNIVQLSSGHPYSSPIGAIEELAANSYDAFTNIASLLFQTSEDLQI